MCSEKLSGVLSEIVFDLLTDIAAGHGDELIEAPILDDSIKGLEACCISELAQFWEGKPSVTRHCLFANILKYCSKDVDIITDITAIIIGAYPSNETKLSKSSIMDSIKHYYAVAEAPKEKVKEVKEQPKVEEPKAEPAPVEPAIVNEEDLDKQLNAVEHNYTMAKTPDKSQAIKEHQEMLEAKRALAAERAALK